jgi:glycosyltransferase involved in cell wall biosynthesis
MKQGKKALVFLSTLVTSSGSTGGEKVDLQYRDLLVQLGFNVSVCELHSRNHPLLAFLRKFRLGKLCINLLLLAQTAWRKADLVFVTHYYSREALLAVLWQKCIFGAKVIVNMHHFETCMSMRKVQFRMLGQWRESLPFHYSNWIVANSKFTKEEIVALGVPPEKIGVIYPVHRCQGDATAVDFKDNSRLIRILYVGTLEERKGPLDLCEAFTALEFHNIELALVGRRASHPSAYFDQIENLARQDPRIRLCGVLDDEEVCALFNRSDIFVLPSHWEGFGIVLLEAMKHGLPIVSTRISAIPELVRDRVDGILVEPRNSQALRSALTELIVDNDKRRSFAEASRKRFVEIPNWVQESRRFRQGVEDLFIEQQKLVHLDALQVKR